MGPNEEERCTSLSAYGSTPLAELYTPESPLMFFPTVPIGTAGLIDFYVKRRITSMCNNV